MYKISLITGDGIGPEISESAVSVLNTINEKYDLKFEITQLSAGDKALAETGPTRTGLFYDVLLDGFSGILMIGSLFVYKKYRSD